MDFGIKALHNLVFIKRLEPDPISKGGIIIPETARQRHLQGKVIATGPGKIKRDGSRADMQVKIGDTVFFPDMHGWEASFEGQDYTILREEDVLAVLED